MVLTTGRSRAMCLFGFWHGHGSWGQALCVCADVPGNSFDPSQPPVKCGFPWQYPFPSVRHGCQKNVWQKGGRIWQYKPLLSIMKPLFAFICTSCRYWKGSDHQPSRFHHQNHHYSSPSNIMIIIMNCFYSLSWSSSSIVNYRHYCNHLRQLAMVSDWY